MPVTRMEARELMNRGYEMRASVLNGVVHRGEDGSWMVDDQPLDQVLDELEGREVVLISAEVGEGAGKKRTCRTCGTTFEGHECPRCREIHRRLRGP